MPRHGQGEKSDGFATEASQSLGLVLGELPAFGGFEDAVESQRMLRFSGYPRLCTRSKRRALPYKRRTRCIWLKCYLLASNHEHSLVQPLRDRMKLILRFEHYSDAELHQLVQQRARALHWDVDEDVFRLIAARGRGTPRLALRLLESCRRTCRSESETAISTQHFLRTCELEGIDSLGLDRQEIQLLRILEDAAGAVRLNVLASRLGLPPRTVSEVVERHLVQLGLIDKAPEGRRITGKGISHLRGTDDGKTQQ